MARAHDLLSRSDHVQQVNAGGYVADLCAALDALTENDDRIQLEAQVEEGIFVSADRAIPLGLALTELVTNAVKYAFPPPRPGTIRAQVRRPQPGRIELVIQDNGVGMAGLREGSLGYGLVRSLVQQIEGDIDIRSDAGVTVTISFPICRHTGRRVRQHLSGVSFGQREAHPSFHKHDGSILICLPSC
jgi:two-component sensor histidine kinase